MYTKCSSNLPELKGTPSNCFGVSSNQESKKPKDLSFTVINKTEKLQILTFKNQEPAKYLIFFLKK